MTTPHDGMTLVFTDTFSYSGSPPVDPAKWFIGDPRPGNAGFSSAKFLLRGDPLVNTVFVGGGGTPLSIRAAYSTSYTATYGVPWISGLISTAWNNSGSIAGVGIRQGYFEVVMTAPFDPNAAGRGGGTGGGSGTWPGFWLEQFATILGTGPTMEIDTELYGVGDNQFPATSQWWPLTGPTNHTSWSQQVGNTAGFPTLVDFQNVSTTFGMLVDQFNVTWFVNGVKQCVIPLVISGSTDPFFLMIDLGMGGGWTIVPPTSPAYYPLIVTSVNIWQAPGSNAILSPTVIDTTLLQDGQNKTISAAYIRQVSDSLSSGVYSTTQTGSYTLTTADRGTRIRYSSASAGTFTVPTNGSVPFVVNTLIQFCQVGAGTLTIAAAAGVTLVTPSSFTTRTTGSSIWIFQDSINTWILGGDLT